MKLHCSCFCRNWMNFISILKKKYLTKFDFGKLFYSSRKIQVSLYALLILMKLFNFVSGEHHVQISFSRVTYWCNNGQSLPINTKWVIKKSKKNTGDAKTAIHYPPVGNPSWVKLGEVLFHYNILLIH